jgi:hypothetical protein
MSARYSGRVEGPELLGFPLINNNRLTMGCCTFLLYCIAGIAVAKVDTRVEPAAPLYRPGHGRGFSMKRCQGPLRCAQRRSLVTSAGVVFEPAAVVLHQTLVAVIDLWRQGTLASASRAEGSSAAW